MTNETKISGAQGDGRDFSPDMMIWQVDREMALLLAGGRALLMQLAHPKVAAGVAVHSRFKEDPLGRLYRTMSTMWSIVFDDRLTARLALGRVKTVHARVRGWVEANEPLPVGTRYEALDVELLLWVHATLIDSALLAYDLFVNRLTPEQKCRYYQDSKRLASLFEIPSGVVPDSLADFNEYMDQRVHGGEIVVGTVARQLAAEILSPRPWILKPAGPLFRLLTTGLLPPSLRAAYRLGWSERKARMFGLSVTAIRHLRSGIPNRLRIVPNARRAERIFQHT